MEAKFNHFDLRVVKPNFDSPLIEILMELNHLRKMRLGGTTKPWLFFQIKSIFHLLESVGSARIEGNRTTISEYIEQKLDSRENSEERFAEIKNIEVAMKYIEENIEGKSIFTHQFIRELHQLTVSNLDREGDKTPGAYRSCNVNISGSNHIPPTQDHVQSYMDELLEFINEESSSKYDLLKTALAHHRFTWIHPFGNGNGRVVRLITYALMIKYGFNLKKGKLLNPTAVFCNDRTEYYNNLTIADEGSEKGLSHWCEYVLGGILKEVTKVNKLLDFKYLSSQILLPSLDYVKSRSSLKEDEFKVLKFGIENQEFQSKDLKGILSNLNDRQRVRLISKMKEDGFLKCVKEKGRNYYVNFMNNNLMKGLIFSLEKEGFINNLNEKLT